MKAGFYTFCMFLCGGFLGAAIALSHTSSSISRAMNLADDWKLIAESQEEACRVAEKSRDEIKTRHRIALVTLGKNGEPEMFGKKAFWMEVGGRCIFPDFFDNPRLPDNKIGEKPADLQSLWEAGDPRVYKVFVTPEVLQRYPPRKKLLPEDVKPVPDAGAARFQEEHERLMKGIQLDIERMRMEHEAVQRLQAIFLRLVVPQPPPADLEGVPYL